MPLHELSWDWERAVVHGDAAGAKKSTANDIIRRVSDAIASRSHHLIKLPDRAEMRRGADRLFDRFGLPDMPLGVDGTHVPLHHAPYRSDCPPGLVP